MSGAKKAEADPTLRAVEDRVLWLATAIVDHANRVRPNAGGLKEFDRLARELNLNDCASKN